MIEGHGRPPLRVGTRGSPLALRQAAIVCEALQRVAPGLEIHIEVIRAHGDEDAAPAPEQSVASSSFFGLAGAGGTTPSPPPSPPGRGRGENKSSFAPIGEEGRQGRQPGGDPLVGLPLRLQPPPGPRSGPGEGADLRAGGPGEEGDELLPGQGLFVRALEEALLTGRVGIAVHSFKDMPSAQTPGLCVAAFLPREDPRDVLVAVAGRSLAALPPGARVGTGSPRRRALLLALRPDLDVCPIRGNVDTRLRRVAEGAVDGVVLAAAGLRRLGREAEATDWLDPRLFVPAIGQGTLAVQARAEDPATCALAQRIDDVHSRACAMAERAVATTVRASCQTPIAAYAHLEGDRMEVHGFLVTEDGAVIRVVEAGPEDDAEQLGARLGAALMSQAAVIQTHNGQKSPLPLGEG